MMITINVNANDKPHRVKSIVLKEMMVERRDNQTYTKDQINDFLRNVPMDTIDNLKTFASGFDVDIVINPV
jgi:hypothetical protein